MKVGVGVDAHALVEGVPLVLGGVEVESDRGLAGHSDGDVIAHALIDALLGAAGLGDIGYGNRRHPRHEHVLGSAASGADDRRDARAGP